MAKGESRTIIIYTDAAGAPADAKDAVFAEIIEINSEKQIIKRTYASLQPDVPSPFQDEMP